MMSLKQLLITISGGYLPEIDRSGYLLCMGSDNQSILAEYKERGVLSVSGRVDVEGCPEFFEMEWFTRTRLWMPITYSSEGACHCGVVWSRGRASYSVMVPSVHTTVRRKCQRIIVAVSLQSWVPTTFDELIVGTPESATEVWSDGCE